MISQVLRMTMLIAIPCAVGEAVLARPVIYILFPQKASLETASLLLTFLAFSVIFYSLSTVTNAILQSTGKVWIPMLNAVVAIIFQGVMLYLLLRFTSLTNMALVFALLIHSGLMCIFNHIFVMRLPDINVDRMRTYILPLGASAVMGAVSYPIHRIINYLLMNLTGKEYLSNLICLNYTQLYSFILLSG